MTKFSVSDLPTETKNLHETQNKWYRKNWQKTLKEHTQDIEKLLKKINLFDVWSNKLQHNNVAIRLIREIIVDTRISIHFVGFGLYKYAHMCLRSELETALRLVYFSTHEVEFKWWSEGNEWYREDLNWPDVWGKGYKYFRQLNEIKNFEKECEDNKKLFGSVSKVYKKLSKFIHTGAEHFQTRADRLSPKYNSDKFREWYKTYEKVQTYINIILALGFADEFKKMAQTQRNKILNTGMDTYYKEKVKQTLGL